MKQLIALVRAIVTRETLITLHNLLKKLKSLTTSPPQSPTVDSPPFDPSQPSIPISYPIKTLNDLSSRSYFNSFHFPFNKSTVPLNPSSKTLPNRPRLLVCHDMQGGYGDDRWVQGGTNPEAYTIWHWHLIDVFVYFSHYLVTLPPPGWTNAAHRHGVKVLGTFITEWDEGKAVCDKLLDTKESAHMYAERLVELAVSLGFDGWLINIENEVDVVKILNLKEFVSHLTRTMHSFMPESLVIWYDSVTIDGALNWQDLLNEKNRSFFDVCDGIFINYTWKSNYPEISAAEAGERSFDVYMGIDVFGRNTFGGGQWNTNVALDVIKKNNVSAAIFAPGWVYETKQPPNFQTAQSSWWNLVEKSWGRINNLPKALPFYTSFDRGHGYHTSVEGEVIDAPWNNMSCQGFQPFFESTDGPASDSIQVSLDFTGSSYQGGGNITFEGTLKEHTHFTTKLFEGELLIGDTPLQVLYWVKSSGHSLLGLCLQFSSNMDNGRTVFIASDSLSAHSEKFSEVIVANQVRKPETAAEWILYEVIVPVNGSILKEIHAICYWSMPGYGELKLKNEASSHDKSLDYSYGNYFSVLGQIAIRNPKDELYFPSSGSWRVEGQYIQCTAVSHGYRTVSLKITWKLNSSDHFWSLRFNIYVEKITQHSNGHPGGRQVGKRKYIGVAHVEAFYVSDLDIASDVSSLKFIIQVCGVDGTCQNLDDSPYYTVDIEGL